MKLLIINYEFPPIGGGGATASYQVAERLADEFEIKVLTGMQGNLAKYERVGRYEVYRAPAIRKHPEKTTPPEMLTFMMSGAWHGTKLARDWKPDVMAAFFGIPSGGVSWFINRWTGIPYTISLLGGDVPGFQPYDLALYHKLTKPFIKRIWRDSSGICANSYGLAELAKQTTPELDIGVIANGIDHETFFPSETESSSPYKILFVGRLVKQKAPLDLVKAAAILREKTDIPFQVEFVGDGDLMDELKSLKQELNLGENVVFTGWCPFGELADKYRSADIFCLPSLDEGMPYVVVQAMACGLPVVGTDIMGTQELVTDGVSGYLAPVNEPEKLAESFKILLENPDIMASMRQAAIKTAQDYNWDKFSSSYQQLFERAAKL